MGDWRAGRISWFNTIDCMEEARNDELCPHDLKVTEVEKKMYILSQYRERKIIPSLSRGMGGVTSTKVFFVTFTQKRW